MNIGIVYATGAFLIWGLFPLYFQFIRSVPPLEVVLHRSAWSLVFVLGILAWRRQWTWLGETWRQPRRLGLFAISATLLSANWMVYVLAVQTGRVVDASLGYYINPLVNVLLGVLVLRERLRPLQWVGLACAFAAVAFALREGFVGGGAATGQGDLLGLAGGMLWGLTTVTIRATSLARVSAEKMLFYQVAVSAVAVPPLSLALGETWTWQWSTFATASVVIQVAVGAFASYLAWMWMLGRYPATKISVFVFLTPLFAMLFGALWLHEPITPSLLAALALVAVGIVLVNRKPG